MKISIKAIIAVLLLAVSLTGCKKDDEDKSGYLRVNSDRGTLGTGCLTNWGTDSDIEGCEYTLTLTSPGATFNDFGIPNGSGQLIRFAFISSSLIGLASGVYVFDEDTNPLPYDSFGWAYYCYDWSSSEQCIFIDIISGTITVENMDGVYEITFDLEGANGDAVTGYYNGTLHYLSGML